MGAAPRILVQDWNLDPPLTTRYVLGHNEIDMRKLYAAVKSLEAHHERGKLDAGGTLQECSDDFIGEFFRCCSSLIDYFADFGHIDASMHQLWFHLVDTVQDTAAKLPHTPSSANYPLCTHAESFARAYEETLVLIDRAIQARLDPALDGALIHRRESILEPASYRADSFKAGLKPWQQFLLNNSPGCDCPVAGSGVAVESCVCERRMPMGSLVLIQRHAEVMRHVAEDYAASRPGINDGAFISEFDVRCPLPHLTRTYTSPAGHPTVIRPTYALADTGTEPRLVRHNDIVDPSLICPDPNLWMLNEAAGNYQDENPVQLSQGNDKFRLLVVTSLSKPDATAPELGTTDSKVLDDLFDDWSF